MKLPEENNITISPDIFRAIEFASSAHDGSYRYGKPFIRHPVGAAFLLQQAGADEDVIIAGLLHDIIEHTPFTKEDLSDRFGLRVAELVSYVTEEKDPNGKSWKDRKMESMKLLGAVPLDAVLLRWADKTDSLISLLNEIERLGEDAWDVYSSKEEQIWYYNTISSVFHDRFCGTKY